MGIFYIVVEDYYKITLFIDLVLTLCLSYVTMTVDAADVITAHPLMFVG